MTVQPGERIALGDIASRSKTKPMLLYGGSDQGVVKAHASDDNPLLILARNNPRRKCEQGFLNACAKVNAVSDRPVVKGRRSRSQLSLAESALSYRVSTILETDYFVTSTVQFGSISHGLPVLVENLSKGINIVLNPEGQTVQLLIRIYETEYEAFGSMAKDFVRSVLFPRLADHVPSSTRQGAERHFFAPYASRLSHSSMRTMILGAYPASGRIMMKGKSHWIRRWPDHGQLFVLVFRWVRVSHGSDVCGLVR